MIKSTRSSNGGDSLHASQYLRLLDDAQTLLRLAERAMNEAVAVAPDELAKRESRTLRDDAAQVRRAMKEFQNRARGRFNPKRQRRVVIEK